MRPGQPSRTADQNALFRALEAAPPAPVIDQVVLRELGHAGQVLILGAGFDTRAYRLPGMDEVRVFELDHPATAAIPW